MRIFPAKKNATGQAIIICPGGGYAYLAYNWEGTDVAKLLNAKGITAIVLKYRLPNSKSNITPNLSPLMDAKRAMRMVRANADKWGIKKNSIGIMGFSAGGHLASTLATHFDEGNKASNDSIEQQSSRPDFAVLIYPVISMDKKITHMGSHNNLIGENADSALTNLYSNELRVTKQTPPTFGVLVFLRPDGGDARMRDHRLALDPSRELGQGEGGRRAARPACRAARRCPCNTRTHTRRAAGPLARLTCASSRLTWHGSRLDRSGELRTTPHGRGGSRALPRRPATL